MKTENNIRIIYVLNLNFDLENKKKQQLRANLNNFFFFVNHGNFIFACYKKKKKKKNCKWHFTLTLQVTCNFFATSDPKTNTNNKHSYLPLVR